MLALRQFIGWPPSPSLSSAAMSNSFHIPQVSRGQAYAMLGGAALMMTLAMGIRQNFGLFQAPAAKEVGIAISDFALAISVQQVAWGLSQPLAGILADRHGTRWVALAGSVLFILGLWLTATAQGALPIVIGAGVLIGMALACTTSGITANIAARVVQPTRRTLAFGIVSAAGSVGTMLTAPIAAYLLNHDSWRTAVWAFVILALAMLPAAWIGSRADKLTTHLPTYLAQCGMDASYSAIVLMLIGGFNIVSSWLFGWLGDRYPKRLLLGAIYLLRSLILARFFSTLTGIAFLSHQAGSFLGAWGGGYLFDLMGSYDLAWKIGVFVGLVAGTMQLLKN